MIWICLISFCDGDYGIQKWIVMMVMMMMMVVMMMVFVNHKDSRILINVNHQLDDSSCNIFDMNCSKHHQLPSGYLTVHQGKSPFLKGKPSISMGHGFHGELLNNQRVFSGGTYRYDHDGAHLGSGSLVVTTLRGRGWVMPSISCNINCPLVN